MESAGRPPPVEAQRAALAELWRDHHKRLCEYVTAHLGAPELAEDVAQTVWMELWRLRDRRDLRAIGWPYLRRAARHRAVRAATRRRRFLPLSSPISPESLASTPAEELHAREIRRAISVAVDALPERCRATFVLVKFQGRSYREAAATLGVSVKTVETQIGRALKALRRALPRESVT